MTWTHPNLGCARLGPLLLALGLVGGPVQAQEVGPWSLTAYVQQSWPKQTETNRQIQDINNAFGSHFNTWADVANLNLGLHLFHELAPHWKAGLEVDYSQGQVRGSSTMDTPAGPANLAFQQKFTVFAEVMGVVQYRPLGTTGRWVPFVLAGAGVAYERDRTLLSLRNAYLDEGLRVANSGWFPVLTLGLGVDVFLTPGHTWYSELGCSYSWNRLKHSVPATGTLAPGPTVNADTDSTGPSVWLGLGRRF